MNNRARFVATMMAILCSASLAAAAGTPAQKCESSKNDLTGKYLACLAKARKLFVITADAAAYGTSVANCETKLAIKWAKLELSASSAGDPCPTSLDQQPLETFMDGCHSVISDALSGGDIPIDPATCAADLDTCTSDLDACDSSLASCADDLDETTDDLADCEAALAGATSVFLTRTGQTTCWNDAGTTIACPGSGRDGDAQAGDAPAFVDNGDGTITDYNTGLMWEKLSDNGSIHDKDTVYAGLQGAIDKATALNTMNFAGHNDWRIPNLRELGSIFNYGAQNPAAFPAFHTGCVAGCNGISCSCTRPDILATSTLYLPVSGAHYRFNHYDGDMYAAYATDSVKARAVRTAF